ncbi:MAG: hypothetical protein H0X07_04120 [Gemmatimonadales bacterium]|nr:hypothetical protein [Gemmatimonadales bacterium]
MSTSRGRQARLRSEYAGLYPGLEPAVWMPVEKLLSFVTDLIHKDRSRSGVITGPRLLHDDHFEYRGASARPEGLPTGHTRLSDSSAQSETNESSGPFSRAPAEERKSH